MTRHVKGKLFEDYVRMIKKNKQVDWSKYLGPDELEMITGDLILPSGWYPMEMFQRCGEAIFYEIAKGSLEVARAWGRMSVEGLAQIYRRLILEEGDPLQTLEKFSRLSKIFFDFEGFEVTATGPGQIEIKVDRAFGTIAMPAYSHQMLGSFERLLELAGARQVEAVFTAKAWEGAPQTVIALRWQGTGPGAENPEKK